MRKIFIVGNSHIASLHRAWSSFDTSGISGISGNKGIEIKFMNLKYGCLLGEERRRLDADAEDVSEKAVQCYMENAQAADVVIFCINGNQHNTVSLVEAPDVDMDAMLHSVRNKTIRTFKAADKLTQAYSHKRTFILQAPPPIESENYLRDHPGNFDKIFKVSKIRSANDRMAVYKAQTKASREFAAKRGMRVIELPQEILSPKGYLPEEMCNEDDPTHGNILYGEKVLRHVLSEIAHDNPSMETVKRVTTEKDKSHPYVGLPDTSYWKQSMSIPVQGEIDPVTNPPFSISQTDKVATAGSCFAQHISKRLRNAGFNYLEKEPPAPGEGKETYDFSARYGNIYTARQLVQLFNRAFGNFAPREIVWKRSDGRFCDPFRPRIEEAGFASAREVKVSAENHLKAVREMFMELDVFVFTLGLTECWGNRLDGAVYPLAPGVAGGVYNPKRHVFMNFSVKDIVADLRLFLRKLSFVNSKAKVIFTVSPVPLAATFEKSHVLVSTTYSKAVLRVAAHEIEHTHDNVYYFPSFEIITGPHAAGAYFGADRRSVTEQGVDHVMRVFMHRMTDLCMDAELEGLEEAEDKRFAEMEALAEAACDEELYAK